MTGTTSFVVPIFSLVLLAALISQQPGLLDLMNFSRKSLPAADLLEVIGTAMHTFATAAADWLPDRFAEGHGHSALPIPAGELRGLLP